MSSAYAAPSTPPRNRGVRSTSVSAGSPFSSVNGLLSRASPRARLRTVPEQSETTPYKPYRGPLERAKRRDRLKSRVQTLRNALLSRWRATALAVVLVVLLLYWALHEPERPPLIIPNRPYALRTYQHLDFSTPISLRPATRVLHVTKEFGPATMGGLGAMLTALSVAQCESPYLSISVALPHYSYLRERFTADEVQPFANLSIPITTNPSSPSRARTTHVRCPVSLLRWPYSAAADFLNPNAPLAFSASSSDPTLSRTIDIYLLGPSDTKPFSAAFRAKDEGDIYSAYKPLKQEWKDLYFARAAAELIAYLGAKDEATVFEDDEIGALEAELEEEDEEVVARRTSAKRRVDVVHLHGATNAMVAHFLREREREHLRDEPHSRHPAIVYTLHDSLDEVEYSNLVENAVRFLPPPPPPHSSALSSLSRLEPYIYRSSTQLFTSALGIDLADPVTFVSRSIASDIVSGRFRFHLEGLVMPSISRRAAEGAFIGVTNGLDFTERSKNPFTAPALVERGLAFPRVGADVLDERTFLDEEDRAISFADTKQRAKEHLISQLPSLFNHPDDATRPWFLFIGRYQYNKGCQFFSTLLEVLSSSAPAHPQGRLILLGARNNYPFSALQSLARQYPHHLTLIDDVTTPGVQAQWGTFLRMASDFAVVPSLSEAFGLVAAEGLLFGMPVLSTGVGGLREFLVPFSPFDGGRGNSYLFDLFPTSPSTVETQGAEADYSRAAHDVRPDEEQLKPARAELRRATEGALRDWQARRDGSWLTRERFVRRMVADALELKWNREKGPVEEYIRVYDLALKSRRRRLGLPHFIPPPSSSRDDDDAAFLPSSPSARPRPPPFLVHPLRKALEHPVAVPHIKQGGHDRVSGSDGLAHLLVERERALTHAQVADEGAEQEDAPFPRRDDHLDAGNTLPIVKVWGPGTDPKILAKEAAAKALKAQQKKRRRAQQAEQAQGKGKGKGGALGSGKKAALRRTLDTVARRKKAGAG